MVGVITNVLTTADLTRRGGWFRIQNCWIAFCCCAAPQLALGGFSFFGGRFHLAATDLPAPPFSATLEALRVLVLACGSVKMVLLRMYANRSADLYEIAWPIFMYGGPAPAQRARSIHAVLFPRRAATCF